MAHAHPLSSLAGNHPRQASRIDGFVARHGGNMKDFVYLPLQGRTDSYTMVLSRASQQPLDVLAIDPW